MADLAYAPAVGGKFSRPDFRMREAAESTQIELRLPDRDAGQRLAQRLDLQLDDTPLGVAESGGWTALWLRPRGWLLVGPPRRSDEIVRALAGSDAIVVDVSHRFALLELDGDGVRTVLSAATAADLRDTRLPPGRCMRTLLLDQPVLLHRKAPGNRFDIYVDRSIAHAVWSGLCDAAA